jgi:hypothetical protein
VPDVTFTLRTDIAGGKFVCISEAGPFRPESGRGSRRAD